MQIIFEDASYNLNNDESFQSLIQKIRSCKINKCLFLHCSDYSPQDLEMFYDKLLEIEPPLAFSVSLLDQNNSPIYVFEKLKFEKQATDKIEQIKSYIADPNKVKEPVISPHKKRLVKGERIDIPQQQRKIISLPKVNKHANKKLVQSQVAMTNNVETQEYKGDLSKLINLENFSKNLQLQNIYNETFKDTSLKPTFEEIWYSIVGENSSSVIDKKNKVVTHIHYDVMVDFIRNYSKIKQGVFLGALPIVADSLGIVRKVVKYEESKENPPKYILTYKNYTPHDEINSFMPIFTDISLQLPKISDYLNNFSSENSVKEAIEDFFDHKSDRSSLHLNLTTLVSNITKDPKLINTIKKYITKIENKSSQLSYHGLADILVTTGIYALVLVLKQMNSMDFDLIKDLIDNRENFIQFATQEGLDKLLSLQKLSVADQLWWKELIKRHKKAGNSVNFIKLYEVFNDFRNDLGLGDASLPAKFPFENIDNMNMESALYITSRIIKNTQPSQLHYLDGLDLNLLGDYLESQRQTLRLITKEMGLQVDKAFPNLNYSVAKEDFATVMKIESDIREKHLLKAEYEKRACYFYRFIARKDETSPQRFKYENFLEIEECIKSLNLQLTSKVEEIEMFDAPYDGDKIGFVVTKDKKGKIVKLQYAADKSSFDFDQEDMQKIINIFSQKSKVSFNQLLNINFNNTKFENFIIDNNYKVNVELSYASKSSLLYIAAVAGSGKGVSQQASAPNEEFYKFLDALRLFAEKFKINSIEDIIKTIHDIGLRVETCPSLIELANILNKLSLSKRDDGLKIIRQAFGIINNNGDEAVAVFANFSEIAKQHSKDIVDLLNLYSQNNISMFSQEIQPYIVKVFSLFAEKIPETSINNLISSLNRDQQKFFFQKLAMIDIGKSSVLLSADHLSELLDSVKTIFNEKELHTAVQNFFVQKGLDVKFNSLSAAKSTISLTAALKDLIKVYNADYAKMRKNIDNGLYAAAKVLSNGQEASAIIKQGLDEVNNYVQEIAKSIEIEPIDEQALLKIFDKADLRLAYLKDDLVKKGFKWAIDNVKDIVIGMMGDSLGARILRGASGVSIDASAKPYVEAYFNTFSLAVFMDRAIESSVKTIVFKLITDVFGEKDTNFIKYLEEYIADGSKPVRFGIVKSINDPNSIDPKEIKELLHNVDGIVLYNNNLYYIQQSEPLKVSKIDINDKKEIAAQLINKITEKYKIVGLDNYRIIKLNKVNLVNASGESLEESLYKHVRTISLSQDAIISYVGKCYYYNFIEQRVEQVKDERLQSLFVGDFENREAISLSEKQLFKDVFGKDKLHDELSLITNLGINPAIFPSQNVDKYNRKLDKFANNLNKLDSLKEKDFKLFSEYLNILKSLSNNISSVDLIDVLDLLNQLLNDDSTEFSRVVLEKLNFLYIETKQITENTKDKVNLSALIYSLKELSKSAKLEKGMQDNLLKSLIPFTLSGAEFPLDIFLKNIDKSQDFLINLLDAAAELRKKEENDFFDKIEEIKKHFSPLDIEPILSTILMSLVKDIKDITALPKYKLIYDKISKISSTNIDKYVSIFKALSSLQDSKKPESIITLDDINVILDGIEKKYEEEHKYLEDIHNIFFKFEPYLDKSIFMEQLHSSSENFSKYLKFYSRHPYKQANREEAELNFNTDRVLDVIDGIISLPNGIPLSSTERAQLTKQFSYVDTISMGKYPLYLRDMHGKPILVNGKSEFYLHEYQQNDNVVSTEELISIAEKLKEAFYQSESTNKDLKLLSDPTNHEKRRLALQYIAVMRASYYRATGIIPNSTQIITIINALNNPNRQLEEIETAEGKSVTTALFSALLCAKGCTVLVPTSSKSLVVQDYLEKHNNLFFKSLGFDSVTIDQEQDDCKLKYGAIHYGTSRDIDSLIAEYKILGRSLTTDDNKKKYPLACVKDEQDTDLDDQASRTIAVEISTEEDSLSPVWIISAVNRFVESENYKRIEKKGEIDPDDEEQDLRNLIGYLRNEASANKFNKIEASSQVDNFIPFLKGYLAVACQVHCYIEGVDYQVIEKDPHGKVLANPIATPMNKLTSEVERGNTFSDARQAFLHDLLNRSNKYPGSTFKVELDPIQIDTKSNKTLMEDFDYFIGLSATSGNKQEILEVGLPVSKIPPHKVKNRKLLSPIAVKNEEDKHRAIINAVKINGYETNLCPNFVLNILVSAIEIYQKALQILCYIFGKKFTPKDKQPVLIFVNNPIEAEKLYNKFAKINNGYKLQFINGKETDKEYEEKKFTAGESNYITIVVPKDGRGIDYDSKHPEGIFGIRAFNSSLRGGIQVLGRVGRKGKPGKFLEIIEGEEFTYNSLFQKIFGLSLNEKKKQIKEIENKSINSERFVERQERQKVDEKIQIVLNQFDKIRMEFKKCTGDDSKLLLLRGALLKKIKDVLNNFSDKKIDLDIFESNLCQNWKNFKTKELQYLKDDKSLDLEAQVKIIEYIDQDISEEFHIHSLKPNLNSALDVRIKKASKESTGRIVDKYLDGVKAILDYDEKFLSNNKIRNLKILKAEKQIKSIFEQYKWLNLTYTGKTKDIFINFHKLLKKIQEYPSDNYDGAIKCYPVAIEILDIYEDVQNYIEESMQKDNKKLEKWNEIKTAVANLKTNSNQEAVERHVKTFFVQHLGFIHKGLSLLGMRTLWFDNTYTSLLKISKDGDIFNLYKELSKLKVLLDNKPSIFPLSSYLFGTYDLKKLINQTIEYIDYLSDNNKNFAKTLNEECEKGQCEGLFEAYLSSHDLEELRKKVPEDKIEKWDSWIKCFKFIREEQSGFAAIEELLEFFKHIEVDTNHSVKNVSKNLFFSTINKIMHVSDYEVNPKKDLINRLEKIGSKLEELEKNRINSSEDSIEICLTQDTLYIHKKQDSIKEKILDTLKKEGIGRDTVNINKLEILHGSSGNKQIYELRIDYSGDFKQSVIGRRLHFTDIINNAPLEKELHDNEAEIKKYEIAKEAESKETSEAQQNTQNLKPAQRPSILSFLFSSNKNQIPETNKKVSATEEKINLDDQIKILKSKNCVLNEKIERQKPYVGVLVKRFDSLYDLLCFEMQCSFSEESLSIRNN